VAKVPHIQKSGEDNVRHGLGRLARVDQYRWVEKTHFKTGTGNRSEIRGLSSTPKACIGELEGERYYPRRRRALCFSGSAQESDRPPTDVDFLGEDNRLD
jgi:hypothetical protein